MKFGHIFHSIKHKFSVLIGGDCFSNIRQTKTKNTIQNINNSLINSLSKHWSIIIDVFDDNGHSSCGCLWFWPAVLSPDNHLKFWSCFPIKILCIHLWEDPAFWIYVEEVCGWAVWICARTTHNFIVNCSILHVVKVISDHYSNNWAVISHWTRPACNEM